MLWNCDEQFVQPPGSTQPEVAPLEPQSRPVSVKARLESRGTRNGTRGMEKGGVSTRGIKILKTLRGIFHAEGDVDSAGKLS